MDEKGEMKGVQVVCPRCRKQFPVRVQELSGTIRLSVRCPNCKKVSEIILQDIK